MGFIVVSIILVICTSMYSKVSINCFIKQPGMIFSKQSLLNDQVHLRKKKYRTVLFQGHYGQFLVSIKRPGLDMYLEKDSIK